MHRDIKPQNILIDINTKEVFIIDWGLADYYKPRINTLALRRSRREIQRACEYAELQGTGASHERQRGQRNEMLMSVVLRLLPRYLVPVVHAPRYRVQQDAVLPRQGQLRSIAEDLGGARQRGSGQVHREIQLTAEPGDQKPAVVLPATELEGVHQSLHKEIYK